MIQIYLSHLLQFVETETFAAIANSEFLRREFAWVDQRVTHADHDSSWTGIYLYGEHTYFEFLDPTATPWRSADGILFGVDRSGEAHQLHTQLVAQGINSEHGLRTRLHEGAHIPWFYWTAGDQPTEAEILTWVVEIHPDFLAAWHAGLPPAEGGMSRRALLERYRAFLAQRAVPGERLFQDIVEVTLALSPGEAERFVQEIGLYGYQVVLEGHRLICTGPALRFVIVPSTPPAVGIAAFRMTLSQPRAELPPQQFGTSTLRFAPDGTAVWTFLPEVTTEEGT